MKKTRRIFNAAIALTLCAGMLTACSSAPKEETSAAMDGAAGNYYATTAVTVEVNTAADNYYYEAEGGEVNEAPAEEAPLGDNKPSGVIQHGEVEAEEIIGDAVDGAIANKGYFTYDDYFNSEEYNEIIENGYKSVAANPLSTFSVDVDTASYANVRRMIEYGDYINPDAVRI